jgi:YD repeat-containing protein
MRGLILFLAVTLASTSSAQALYAYCSSAEGPVIVCKCDGTCGTDTCNTAASPYTRTCSKGLMSTCLIDVPASKFIEFYDNSCSNPSPQKNGEKQSCGGTRVGDPIELTTRTGIISRRDVTLQEANGPVTLYRTLNTNRVNWLSPGVSPLEGVPKLFGEPLSEPAPYWSLNLTALVYRPDITKPLIRLYDSNGNRSTYNWNPNCTSGTFRLTPVNATEQPSNSLWCTSYGYLLTKSDGRSEGYLSGYGANRTFLTYVENANGVRELELSYGQPMNSAGAALNNCPNPGGNYVPYIRYVTSSLDQVDFRYEPRTFPDAGVSCNLRSIVNRTTPIVSYGYVSGYEKSVGPLVSATRAGDAPEIYPNIPSTFSTDGGFIFSGSGFGSTEPPFMFRQPAYSVFVDQENYFRHNFGFEVKQEIGTFVSGAGNSFSVSSPGKDELHTLANAPEYAGQGRGTVTQLCTPGQSCNSGTETWTRSSSATEASLKVQSRGGDVRATGSGMPFGDGVWLPLSKHVGVDPTTNLTGLNTLGNCKGLECEWYEWQYFGGQLVKNVATKKPSVMMPGAFASVTRRHDSAGQVEAVISSGYTKSVDATIADAPQVGQTVELKNVAMFYRRALAGQTDPFKRVLQVEGPCFVANATDTACTTPGLVTNYEYFDTPTISNTRRLRLVTTYPNGLTGTALTTEYANYAADAFGRPGTVTQNGVTNNYTYDAEGHVTSRSVVTAGGTRNWLFRWVKGKLRAIGYPEGNATRFCYDKSLSFETGFKIDSSTYDCNENSSWELEQPLAIVKTANMTGITTWSEAIRWLPDNVAHFWRFGDLASRQDVLTSKDADKRTHAISAGYVSPQDRRRYWQDELVSAIGHSFNAPPEFCFDAVSNTVSTQCTTLDYNGARRLTHTSTTLAGEPSIETNLLYNSNGQLCDSNVGGASGLSCDKNMSGTNLQSTSFEYDDFGNVLTALLPNTRVIAGFKSGLEYRYDASNQVVLEQDIARGTRRWYARDLLGRRVSVRDIYRTVSFEIYGYTYDTNQVPSVPGINFPCFPTPTNVLGRTSKLNH